jgi:type II secretory pathway pseudopilin PulG
MNAQAGIRGDRRSPARPHTVRRAVTLFELAVVVVVTAILAAILILSTHFVIIRTKLSRVKEEQRVLARALQNYQMDYSFLPPEESGLKALTAPTAYLASVPTDPFSREKGDRSYFYFSPDGSGHSYAIVSAGPDGLLDVNRFLGRIGEETDSGQPAATAAPSPGSPAPASGPQEGWFQDYLVSCTYDPTNGTTSAGDIVTLISDY